MMDSQPDLKNPGNPPENGSQFSTVASVKPTVPSETDHLADLKRIRGWRTPDSTPFAIKVSLLPQDKEAMQEGEEAVDGNRNVQQTFVRMSKQMCDIAGDVIAEYPGTYEQLKAAFPKYTYEQLLPLLESFKRKESPANYPDINVVRNHNLKSLLHKLHDYPIYRQTYGSPEYFIFEDPEEVVPNLADSLDVGHAPVGPLMVVSYPITALEYGWVRGKKYPPLKGHIYQYIYMNAGEKRSKTGTVYPDVVKAVRTVRLWDDGSEVELEKLEADVEKRSGYRRPKPREHIPLITDADAWAAQSNREGLFQAPFRSYLIPDVSLQGPHRMDYRRESLNLAKGSAFEQLVLITIAYNNAFSPVDSRVYPQYQLADRFQGASAQSVRADGYWIDASGQENVVEVKYGRAVEKTIKSVEREKKQLQREPNAKIKYHLVTLNAGPGHIPEEYKPFHEPYRKLIEIIDDSDVKRNLGILSDWIIKISVSKDPSFGTILKRVRTFLFNVLDQANHLTAAVRQEYIKRTLTKCMELYEKRDYKGWQEFMAQFSLVSFKDNEYEETYRGHDGEMHRGMLKKESIKEEVDNNGNDNNEYQTSIEQVESITLDDKL
ncbi:MAG: hypothetical protein M1366_00840 [Patescibacteria group bacterium]|nr:hypothetical protein [Patescibacteria group bacterium]